MPPALQPAKLSKIKPSAEELAEARRNIAALSNKGMNSIKVSMKRFLEKNPDADAGKLDKSTTLEMFHVHSLRCKADYKKVRSVHSLKIEKKATPNTKLVVRRKNGCGTRTS